MKALQLLLLLNLSITAVSLTAQDDNFLSPELREKVESLKQAVERNPTTPGAYTQRARVLWDWANAYALSGGFLPVNLTTSVRPVVPSVLTRRLLLCPCSPSQRRYGLVEPDLGGRSGYTLII